MIVRKNYIIEVLNYKKTVYKSLISSVIVLIIFLECLPLTVFANNNETYMYIDSNGEALEYYIDSDGHEYI